MKYKLVAADFDGTLYDGPYPDVTPRNREAIKAYTEAGGLFFIATGRMYRSIRPYAELLNQKDEIIAYQGASIYNLSTNELLLHTAIPEGDAVKILKYIEATGRHSQIYYNDTYYTPEETEYTLSYCRYCGVPFNLTHKPLSEYIAEKALSPTKIMVIMPGEELTAYAGKISSHFKGEYNFARSSRDYLEVVSKDADKGRALKWLAARYGIKMEETVAIGDSTNDIPMIRCAGLGAAVGNAMDELKAEADYIGLNAADDAVADILGRIIKETI